MQQLTDFGWQRVNDLSRRYGVSTDAVLSLLQSVSNGGGTMAQFYHNELGGGGQWMQGGMTMVGDMFNHGLKAKVDGLCTELSGLLQQQPFVPLPPPPQYHGGQQQQQGGGASLFVQNSGGGNWWPGDFGWPTASGGQNNVRYAYFANARRLAVDVGGRVSVYDTLNHQIGGVSQQQGSGSSVTFTSQFGTVSVLDLPIISGDGVAQPAPQQNFYNPPPQNVSQGPRNDNEADIFGKIERLAGLAEKGMISKQEFESKKAELLARI